MKLKPVISVVMPVFNYGRYIKESIDSVLSQTFPDFELIIVNDGSTDYSSQIAHSYSDKRVRIIDFSENKGCYSARNAGMRTSEGKYICVMDADDVCLPDRLKNQYRFMEENPEIGLIGGALRLFNSFLTNYRETDYETIKLYLLRFCYLCHPTCMIKSSLIEKYDLYYNESYRFASDYDWQVRSSSLFPVSNINDNVLLHRMHDQQITSDKKNDQAIFANQIRLRQLSFFDILPTENEKELHLSFIRGAFNEKFDKEMIERWIVRLLEGNDRTRYFSHQKLQDFLHAHKYYYFNRKIEV